MERKTKLVISKLRLPFFRRLKRREARASDITNASSDAFILFDRNLNIVGMNPVVRSIFHLILGENVIGEDVPTGAPNMKRNNKNNGRYEKYLNAIRKGKPFFADSIVIHSGLLDINLKAEAFKVGKGFGIIFSDLDALKKAEKTPYDSQKGLAINLQNVPDCIFIFDLKGTVLHGSRAGERLTGYAWEEIKGRSLFEIPLFAPEYLPQAAQLLELSASGKPAGPDEFELIGKDGSRVSVEISTCPIGWGDEVEVIVIAHDITERKKSEEALRKSEERYEAIVETSLDGIYQVDTLGKFIFINESFASTFGYRREELLGKHFSSLLDLETFPKVKEMVGQVLAGENVRDGVPVQHKDGHEVLVNFSAAPLKDCGKIIGLTGILRDITERKLMEEELANSEAKYRSLIETAGAGVAIIDLKGELTLVNEALCRMIGYSQEELLGRNFADFLHPDDKENLLDIFAKGLEGEKEHPALEFRGIHKDGHSVWCYCSPTPIVQGDEMTGFSAIIRDITARKRVEEALRDSEAKYRSLIETAGSGVAATDLRGDFVLVNEALCRMTGYSQEESLGRNFADFLHPDDKTEVLESFAQGLAGKREPPHLEFRTIHKDGHNVWCYSTPTAIVDGNELIGFSAIIHDITERKKAEEELRDSEERFRSILENAPFGYYRVGKDGLWQYVNPVWERMHGFSLEEVIGKPFEITQTEDAVEQSRELIERALAREAIAGEFSRLRKDGDIEYHSFNIQPVKHGNEIVAIEGFISDITERKKAEEALRQSEERFRNVLDNSLDMIYWLNLKTGEYDYVSPSSEKIVGYTPDEMRVAGIVGGRSLVHPDDGERLDQNVIDMIMNAGDRKAPSAIEYRVAHKELGYRWVFDNRSIVYDGDEPVGIVGSLRDITERKRAEEALRAAELKYRIVADNTYDWEFWINPEGRFIYVSPSCERITGHTAAEFEANPELLTRIAHPEDRAALLAHLHDAVKMAGSASISFRVICPDRTERWIEHICQPVLDSNGKFIGRRGSNRDITERRQMEETLRQSEERFRSVLNNSPDLVYRMDLRTGKYDYLSPASRALLGYSSEEYQALSLEEDLEIVHPEDRDMLVENCWNIVTHPQEEGKYSRIEYRALHRELGYRWFSDSRSVIYDDRNAPVAVIGNLRDVTERKQAEEAVRESERKFRSVLEHSVDVIYQVNLKTGTYDYVSPSSVEALGYSSEELIALGFEKATSVIHPDDVEMVKEHFNKLTKRSAADDKGPQTIEYRIQHRELGYRWMSDTSLVLCDDNNVPIAITGNVRDITKRKKAEEALKESEEGYRALVDTAGLAGEGIMIVERAERNQAVIAFVNDALSGMLGYQREEMLGMPARDLFLPGDRIWLQDKHRRRRKGEALPGHYGVVALRKDGSMLPIEISMGAMRYQGKSTTVVYARDVTERKKAEEALRESEAQFRAIFDGAAIGVGLLDVNGQLFRINPALGEMLGYTVEELRSKPFSEYMHPDDAKLDLRLFREMVAGKRDHYQVEKRFIKGDGQIVWGRVTLSAVRGLGGKFQFAIGMIEDITDSKLALDNVKKSEERFRSLIENASEVVLIVDKDGTSTYASPSVERILGYRLEEGIGQVGFSFIHPDDMPEVMKVFNELMQNPGTAVSMQLRVRHKDGSWRIAEAIGKNLLDDPAVGGIVVNYRDVTEREQAHEELLRHTRWVEALHAVAQAGSQTLELEELLNTLLDEVIEVMEAEAGCVYLLDMVDKELVLRTSRGLSDATISRLATIKLNENNVQKILGWKGGSTPLRKIFEETGLSITAEVKEKEQIESFAVAPFAVRGQLSGLIAVGNRAYRKFSLGDIDLLRAVGNQIGIGTQNAMLYEEVRALIRETIDAQERERERICLEVHDGVAQTLVSAFQYLQALEATAPEDAQTKQLLAKTSAQVKQAIQESREVINSLQPATLSDLGLVTTLRHELKRLGQETGLKIDFKADAIRLPKDIETGLYRIIREAVFNARKHANTKQLRVKISSEDERVKVEVRDWGKGFDQAYLDRARKRGTGLFSIRKRAELMKGACEIRSEPGQGTTVRVEIPVNAAERSSG